MIEKLAKIPLLYPPNKKWHYSIATDVLGHLVEKVSRNRRWGQFFKKKNLTPLI